MPAAYLNYPELFSTLSNFVSTGRSGTFFISTNNNHVITFALDSGRIAAIFHGGKRGRKAIPLVSKIAGGTWRFDEVMLPIQPQDLPSTAEILQELSLEAVNLPLESINDAMPLTARTVSDDALCELVENLEKLFARYLGPFGKILFDEAIETMGESACKNREKAMDLVRHLANEVDDPVEAKSFAEAGQQFVNKTFHH